MTFRILPHLFFALSLAFAGNAAAAQKKSTPSAKPAAKSGVSEKKKAAPAEVYSVDPSGKPPEVRAAAYILLDANTGQVLLESNADAQRPVASTQKLLTSLIVAESGNLAEVVRVEAPDTWTEPSMLYIKPGETYSRLKLMQILLVHSMNDVARCLARDNAGSVEEFAQRMNAKARQLGMFNSHFLNPNGLPAPGQYSTARDMSKVGMAAYRNRVLRNTVSMKTMNWTFSDGRVKTFETTNRVLKNYALCNGMKTGYTNAAGFCLISSASNGNRDVIAVVLGAQKGAIWTDSYRLLAWGLANE
jgi:D-alanyl-D-alanine carboxypeptidase (penicillin-binding protein 5/6)